MAPLSLSVAPGFNTTPADQVGGVADMTSSEKVVRISAPLGMKVVLVKFVQAPITRPVSGSTSMNSLSAASNAFAPDRSPFGFVAAVTSNGPVHVWPQSVDR